MSEEQSKSGRTPSPDADFPTCGRCGAYPVRGFASVWRDDEQVWLCQGDDDPSPTCYESGLTAPARVPSPAELDR